MSQHKTACARLALSVTLILFWVAGCSTQNLEPPVTPLASARKIISQTLPVKEKWRVRPGMISIARWPTMKLVKLGLLVANAEQQLVLFGAQDGQVLWQTKYAGSADSLVSDNERVYLSSDWRISAYRLAGGQLLWQSNQQEAHKAYYLYLRDGFLFEYEIPTRGQQVLHEFDRVSGVEIDKRIVPLAKGAPYLYLPLEQVDLLRGNDSLVAIEVGSNKTLWRIPQDAYDSVLTPMVTNDLLVLTIGRLEMRLLILRLDTGEILWQKPGMVSNAVAMGDTVYAIATDGSIRAYELSNGREIGEVKMDPAATRTDRGFTYALVADPAHDMVYAYYGDSEDLIALGR
jgi:outer membrane protein assembly factor BamB